MWRRMRSSSEAEAKKYSCLQPQFLPGRRRVARIEDLGDRLGPHRFGKRADIVAGVESFELQRVGRPRRPQAQRVDMPAAPADDRRIVGDRFDRLGRMPDVAGALVVALNHFDPAAEADRVIVFGTDEFPWIAVDQPVLRRFLLPAAADDLAEQAVVVADAVAVRGDGQRRHAVHETRGEAAEAAIAQRRVGLDPAQVRRLTPSSSSASAIGCATPRLVRASNNRRPIRNSSER